MPRIHRMASQSLHSLFFLHSAMHPFPSHTWSLDLAPFDGDGQTPNRKNRACFSRWGEWGGRVGCWCA